MRRDLTMPMSEPLARRRPIRQGKTVAAVPAIAVVLIAGLIGFVSAPDSSDEGSDPEVPTAEIFKQAREATLRQISADTTRQGFRDGRSDGVSHGKKAGRMAGSIDANIAISQQEVATAQAEAASAQSELSAISVAPPAP